MKIVEPERLGEVLRDLGVSEPRVVASGNFATPQPLLEVLDGALPRYRLFMLAARPGIPNRDGVIFETPFVGAGMRLGGDRLDYLPMRLSLVPRLFDTLRPPDVVLLHTSTLQKGRVSLGIEVNVLPAAVERVRARGGLVVAQCNPHMPYTLGHGELREDFIDFAIEVDDPLPTPPPIVQDARATEIAQRISGLVPEEATLQLGIGHIPDATLRALADRRGLSIWSEMISDGVVALDRAGALAQGRSIVCSFMFGSRELYDWADWNPRVRMTRTEVVNDPSLIASHNGMVSVNGALQVDLFDQAGASHVHGCVYSGFGGQPDFVEGALRSAGGHAIIALMSWHDHTNSSTIVPRLDGPVTSFQHSAIVTEQGCALLFGRSQRAQARLMIENAAHPDARDHLREHAVLLGLRPATAAAAAAR